MVAIGESSVETVQSAEALVSPELAAQHAVGRLLAIGHDQDLLRDGESLTGHMQTIVQAMPTAEAERPPDRRLAGLIRSAFANKDLFLATTTRARALMAIALIGDRYRQVIGGDSVAARYVLYGTLTHRGVDYASQVVAGDRRKPSSMPPIMTMMLKRIRDAGWQGFESRMQVAVNGADMTPESMIKLLPDMLALGTDRAQPIARAAGRTAVRRATQVDVPDSDIEQKQPSEKDEYSENEDSVGWYKHKALRTPLLSAEQEVELSKKIEAGVLAGTALEDNAVFQRLVEDTVEMWIASGAMPAEIPEYERDRIITQLRRDLPVIAREAETAKNNFIEANLRLVVNIAKRHIGRGMQFADIIQEGNLGLHHAVEMFDYTKGYKFSTYATWWIRQSISRALADDSRTVRLPIHMHEKLSRMGRIRQDLVNELGRDPNDKELAAALEVSPKTLASWKRAGQASASLNARLSEDSDAELGDMVYEPDERDPVADHVSDTVMFRESVADMLHSLPEREAAILRLRHGLIDGRFLTLDETGQVMGLSRERIRQLEEIALQKLARYYPDMAHYLNTA